MCWCDIHLDVLVVNSHRAANTIKNMPNVGRAGGLAKSIDTKPQRVIFDGGGGGAEMVRVVSPWQELGLTRQRRRLGCLDTVKKIAARPGAVHWVPRAGIGGRRRSPHIVFIRRNLRPRRDHERQHFPDQTDVYIQAMQRDICLPGLPDVKKEGRI